VDLSDYEDYWDPNSQIGQFIEHVYMHKRIHSALDYLTPVEFEHLWFSQQGELESIHEGISFLCLIFGAQYT